jgi:hypothetical protein
MSISMVMSTGCAKSSIREQRFAAARRTVTSDDEQAEAFDHPEGAERGERQLRAGRKVIKDTVSRGRAAICASVSGSALCP